MKQLQHWAVMHVIITSVFIIIMIIIIIIIIATANDARILLALQRRLLKLHLHLQLLPQHTRQPARASRHCIICVLHMM